MWPACRQMTLPVDAGKSASQWCPQVSLAREEWPCAERGIRVETPAISSRQWAASPLRRFTMSNNLRSQNP